MGLWYHRCPLALLALPPSSSSTPLFPRLSCPCHPRPSSGRRRRLLPVVVIICFTSSASSGPHHHVVLTIVIPAPVSSGARPRPSYRCLVLVPVVILGPSPTSLVCR